MNTNNAAVTLAQIQGAGGVGSYMGATYYVDSEHARAADSGPGNSPNRPFATIDYAIGRCTASQGDVILVAPRHVESISATTGLTLDCDVAGITIRGIGQGNFRPNIEFDVNSTATTVNVTAANVTIENLIFNPVHAKDAIAVALTIAASGCTIKNCRFLLANATYQATDGILTDATCDNLIVADCEFLGTADAGTAHAIKVVGGDNLCIRNNRFHGAYTSNEGAIYNVTTACTKCRVIGNTINNLTASCTKAMVFDSASTGQIARNDMQILSSTAPITGAAMSWIGGNYYAATIGTGATLV